MVGTLFGIAIAEIAMFNKGPRTILRDFFLVITLMDAVEDLA